MSIYNTIGGSKSLTMFVIQGENGHILDAFLKNEESKYFNCQVGGVLLMWDPNYEFGLFV